MSSERVFATARVRQVTHATQLFLFIVITHAYQVFAYGMVPGGGRVTWMTGVHLALMFSPFILARITPLMAITPNLFLRDGAQIQLHDGGLIYTFDAVKRPLFLAWSDVESLRKTRYGFVFTARPREELFEGMPKYQGEFWRARTRKPIRLNFVGAFEPARGYWLAIAAARRAGVEVTGFDAEKSLAEQPATP